MSIGMKKGVPPTIVRIRPTLKRENYMAGAKPAYSTKCNLKLKLTNHFVNISLFYQLKNQLIIR